jgi:twitching motility protein PilT
LWYTIAMILSSQAGFHALFTLAAHEQASDIHCMTNMVPVMRVQGRLKKLEDQSAFTDEQLLSSIDQLLTPELQQRYRAERELDTPVVLDTGERFRVNLFWEKGNPALAARYIPAAIPSLDDLLAPEAAYDVVNLKNGLVLVTGPTGSGKSTLLAAMIEEINNTRKQHIITLEDPIEFLYTSKQSVIAQRQLGQDFLTYTAGLKYIMRQDPDVILIGEMRDLETISAAITLAETGHLVFATLHTNSAAETVERIVDAFPAEQQSQIRLQLAFVLRCIISQILVPRVDGSRIAAHEVLVNNTAIANLIRENKTNQIQNVIYAAQQEHMNTLDQELHWLVREGFITQETAVAHAHNPEGFL